MKVVRTESLLFSIKNMRASGMGKRTVCDALTEIVINNTIEVEPIVHCGKCHFAERYTMYGEPRLFCTNENAFYDDVREDGYCYCGIRSEVEE